VQGLVGVIAEWVAAHVSVELHPEEADWETKNRSRALQSPVKSQETRLTSSRTDLITVGS
jgi:hypothetical protein